MKWRFNIGITFCSVSLTIGIQSINQSINQPSNELTYINRDCGWKRLANRFFFIDNRFFIIFYQKKTHAILILNIFYDWQLTGALWEISSMRPCFFLLSMDHGLRLRYGGRSRMSTTPLTGFPNVYLKEKDTVNPPAFPAVWVLGILMILLKKIQIHLNALYLNHWIFNSDF